MNEMLDMKTIIDIGFVLFVVAICARSLRGGTGNGAANLTAAWKGELEQLTGSLRELVDEASASSRNLDRKLIQRKKELESLLLELDQRAASFQDQEEDDYPNETWRVEPKPRSQPVRASEPAAERYTDHAQKIEKALQKKKEQLQAKEVKKPMRSQLAATLASQIEITKEKEEKEFINNPTSITDPVALSIAKRLLLAGKELHVIARKIDVPVSEIRALETYLRSEGYLIEDPRAVAPTRAIVKESSSVAPRNVTRSSAQQVVELEAEVNQRSSLEDLVDEIEDRTSF